jgi:hypothetical protein
MRGERSYRNGKQPQVTGRKKRRVGMDERETNET